MSKISDIVGKLTRGQSRIERFLGLVSAFIIMCMMFITSIDVIMRYVFNSPLAGGFELQEFLLVGVVFLSQAYVQSAKGHFSLDLLTTRLPSGVQTALLVLGRIICLVIFALITWQSGVRAWIAWTTGQTREGLISFPLWPAKFVLPIGMGLLCLRFISDIAADFRDRPSKRLAKRSGGLE